MASLTSGCHPRPFRCRIADRARGFITSRGGPAGAFRAGEATNEHVSLTAANKKRALEALKVDRLRELAWDLYLHVDDRRSREQLVKALADGRRIDFGVVLERLSRDELKSLCRTLELDDGGRAKDAIIDRILGGRAVASEPAARPAAPKTPRANGHAHPHAQAAEKKRMNDVAHPTSPAGAQPAGSQPAGSQPSPALPSPHATARTFEGFSEITSFIWSVADLLRGDYKQSEYGRVILPLTVLRRLDQVLAPTRDKVLAAAEKYEGSPEAIRDKMLRKASGHGFYNTSRLDFPKLLDDPGLIAQNMTAFVNGFSPNARDIVDHFRFEVQIERLDRANLLFLVVQKFAAIDLHPSRVSNEQMGSIFEELIRKFAEQSNETAGEHFTPREVIRLMVDLLFVEDSVVLTKPGIVKSMLDPACGTGGMLSVAEDYLAELNPDAEGLQVFGQELNGESYAICKADMLIKGQNADNIKYGNSFSEDGLQGVKADYLISNPPFGVDWTKAEKVVRAEHENLGFAGRFGPGLPRKNDGSLLFLLHMMSKMKPVSEGGSRLAIVFNGSPLFTGAAGSGESEIRRYLLENDLLEAIVALPDQMFYNTGINTYIWVVTNRKPKPRRGKVQLINGVSFFRKMRKSLGDKRKELGEQDIATIVRLFNAFEEGPHVKIFDNEDFGFQRITVERPLKLDFQASPERLARLEDEKPWQALLTSKKKGAAAAKEIEEGQALQEAVRRVLARFDPERVYLSRSAFKKDLKAHAKAEDVTIPTAVAKAILSALSERNEEAEVCRDKQGNPEPDTELRDYENVPLKDDIAAYLEREVLPHVPDAWIDESKTKIGYEIPFTRHFYEYTPPRPLAEIEAEIRALEDKIQGMLQEVVG